MLFKILIFQEIVPAYRIGIFRTMYERFGSLLCHSLPTQLSKVASAYEKIDFPNEILGSYFSRNRNQKILPILRKYRPKIVIVGLSAGSLTFLKLMLLKEVFGYKIIAWGHGIHNYHLARPLSGFRGLVMKGYLMASDAMVFYSENRKNMVSKIMPRQAGKMFIAWNTLETEKFKNAFENFDSKGVMEVKSSLGESFSAKYNLIFIGRLLKTKGLDILLKAFEILESQIDVHLHIVGEGEEEMLIRNNSLLNTKLYYYGPIYDDDETGKLLYASDLFVMPGYLGLSIIHAFAFGLPVISCRADLQGPFHSPEIEYLEHGKNGLLVSKHPEELADEIKVLLRNTPTLAKMKKSALTTAYKRCALDKMMEGFKNAIEYVS